VAGGPRPGVDGARWRRTTVRSLEVVGHGVVRPGVVRPGTVGDGTVRDGTVGCTGPFVRTELPPLAPRSPGSGHRDARRPSSQAMSMTAAAVWSTTLRWSRPRVPPARSA